MANSKSESDADKMYSGQGGMTIQIESAQRHGSSREWITAVYPLYLEELSQYDQKFYRRLPDGTWQPDLLPFWFSECSAHPLVAWSDGVPRGFAFIGVTPFLYKSRAADVRLSEFWIEPHFRRKGLGRGFAGTVFGLFRGVWQVTELKRNVIAIAFWLDVIARFTSGSFEDVDEGDVQTQFFRSHGIEAGAEDRLGVGP